MWFQHLWLAAIRSIISRTSMWMGEPINFLLFSLLFRYYLDFFKKSTKWEVNIRDQSKFTGFLGRVLGKICLKKSLRPPFFNRKKVFAPLIFYEKKLSPPFFGWKKSLRPPDFFRKKLFAPLFYFSQKQPYLKSWKRLNVFVVCIILQWTHLSHLTQHRLLFGFFWKMKSCISKFCSKKSLHRLIFF